MAKVYFHLGAHKTASSFLQVNFGANRAELAKQNWRMIRLKNDVPTVFSQVSRLRDGKKLGVRRTKLLDRFFRSVRKDPANTFLTCEGYLGNLSLLKTNGVLYPHHVAMLKRLKKSLKGKEITLGFSIRNFGNLLESGYSQLVLGGATHDFDTYIRAASVESLSWVKIVENMVKMFGSTHVRIWTFEDFKKDSGAAFRTIAKSMSVDSDNLTISYEGAKNASFPPHTIPLAIAWNEIIQNHGGDMEKKAKDRLRRNVRKLLSRVRTNEVSKPLLNPELRARLSAHYDHELSVIRERWPDVLLHFGSESSDQVIPKPVDVAGILQRD